MKGLRELEEVMKLAAEAASFDTSAARLSELAASKNQHIRYLVAKNPNTNPTDLFALCDDVSREVREKARSRI